MKNQDTKIVFDYRALRLLMGLIAFFLPVIVSLLSQHASPKLCTLVQGFSCYTGMLQLANE